MSFLVKTEEAVRTLVDFLAADAGKSAPSDDVNELFAPASENKCVPVDLQLAFLVAPAAHRVPLYFTVPHETVSGSLCLITPAPQRKFKDKVFALSEDGDAVAKRVRRVIDSQKLAAKVVGPVAVRAFAKSYDHLRAAQVPAAADGRVPGASPHPCLGEPQGQFCGEATHGSAHRGGAAAWRQRSDLSYRPHGAQRAGDRREYYFLC